MLITFKSDAGSDVIMLGDVGQKLLEILGKDPQDAKGIVTVEQLPGAIERLKLAIEADKIEQAEKHAAGAPMGDPCVTFIGENTAPVSLVQRAFPLLELLMYALRDQVPLIWQVS